MTPLLPLAVLDRVIDLALEEDAARGDVTTSLTIDPGARGVAHAETREQIVVAGLDVFARTFTRVDPSVQVEPLVQDGATVGPRAHLALVRGPVAAILMGERVALNLLQRMCGIATTTAAFVEAARRGGKARVVDTRKTTPGLRVLERYAVRCGGGLNHREDLGSGVLIKDNHVAACGGVGPAVAKARAHAPHPLKIEVEVSTLAELDEAIARTGVDVISAGALTHSVRAADIALELHA